MIYRTVSEVCMPLLGYLLKTNLITGLDGISHADLCGRDLCWRLDKWTLIYLLRCTKILVTSEVRV